MPKIVDAGAQRREIRRAARRVVARRGLARTGLVHVAQEAGMGRTSLYHYYPDRQSLVRDLVRELLDEEAALFASAARGPGGPLERLDALLASSVELLAAWAAVGRGVLDLRSVDARRLRAFFARIRGELGALVAEGQRAGEIEGALDPELVAAIVIGAIDGLLLQKLADSEVFGDRKALCAQLSRLVRRGVAP
jgi:AcrR family transcriptional regulator